MNKINHFVREESQAPALSIISSLQNADLTEQDEWGVNILGAAIEKNDPVLVEAILVRMTPEQRIQPMGMGNNTALHMAMSNHDVSGRVVNVICRYLTPYDYCRTNSAGKTPLQVVETKLGDNKEDVLCRYMTKTQLLKHLKDEDSNCRFWAKHELGRRNIDLNTPYAKYHTGAPTCRPGRKK